MTISQIIKTSKELGRKGNRKYISKQCVKCKQDRWIEIHREKASGYTGLCSKCFIAKGADNSMWKGGRTIVKGYVRILHKKHSLAIKSGYILEHRLIASQKYGVEAVKNMIVHHKDGNKLNNKIENLEIVSRSGHPRLHLGMNSNLGKPNSIIFCKCGCNGERLKYDKRGRQRKEYMRGHTLKTEINK